MGPKGLDQILRRLTDRRSPPSKTSAQHGKALEMASTIILGNFLSSFVRKVLVTLELKSVPYRVDPVSRNWLALLDDQTTVLGESSVLCRYLEQRYPDPRLFAGNGRQRARIDWWEKFADRQICDVLVFKFARELEVTSHFKRWRKPDESKVTRAVEQEIPGILDFLEKEAPADGFLLGPLSLADIAVASPFRNAAYAGYWVDPDRWPRTAALLDRIFALPPFERLKVFEEACYGLPLSVHRRALAEVDAPLTS